MKHIVKLIESTAVALLILLSLLIIVQVVLRNLIGWGFVWAEEMARYLLLSLVLIMTPIMFHRGEHVRLEFLRDLLPLRFHRLHTIIVTILITTFFCIYVYSHFQLIEKMGDVRTPSLNIPNTWFFIAGLIGAILGIVFGILKIIALLRSGDRV